MLTYIVKIKNEEIDATELRDQLQALLEEELPYMTDGAVTHVHVTTEQIDSST